MHRRTRHFLSGLIFGYATSLAFAQPATSPASKTSGWEPAIAHFEEMDRSNTPAAGSIVFYGSSTIRKWNLQKFFPDLPVVNRGFGGSQMSDAATFEPRVIPECHPKIVVLYSGDNDVADKKSPEEIVGQFEKFADEMHQDVPDAKLIVISIKPSIARWALYDVMKKANALLQDAVRQRPWATYLNIDPLMLDANGQPIPSLFQTDHLHMTDAGYQLWSDALRPLLK